MTANESAEFAKLDDNALFELRAQMRAELERLPPRSPERTALVRRYDASTEEVDDRGRRARCAEAED